MTDYLLLFWAAFFAATVLPFYSEILLAGLVVTSPDRLALLWLVATLGNTLGSVVNWGMGLYLEHFKERRWFPVRAADLERAQRWYQRVGVWSLLLAWAPIGGDALTVISGVMRVRLPVFLVLVFIGKGIRFAVVIFIVATATAQPPV